MRWRHESPGVPFEMVAGLAKTGKTETMDDTVTPLRRDDCTTVQAARLLGVSVRSIQLMVDRGELEAWKTSGGHRRIARDSVERWRESRRSGAAADPLPSAAPAASRPTAAATAQASRRSSALLIDDSIHFQKLVAMLFEQHFPEVDLHIADDGIAGLAQYGLLQPEVLIVDILLPGIDGATLITSLRSHAAFARSRIAVVTSLNESQRAPYRFAIDRIPVIHKPRLVVELPALLKSWLVGPAPLLPARA